MTSELPAPFPELFAAVRRRLWIHSAARIVLATAAIVAARTAHSTLVTCAVCVVVAVLLGLPLAIEVLAVWPMHRRQIAALTRDLSRLAWAHAEADHRWIELHDCDDDRLYVRVSRTRHAAIVAALRAHAPRLRITTTPAERTAYAPIAEHLAKLRMVERGFADPNLSPRVRELGAPYARWLDAWTARDHDEVARGEAVIALDQILLYQRCARDPSARGTSWFVDDTARAIAALPRPDAAASPFRQ